MPVDDWFLTAAERGNSATTIDRRAGSRPDDEAWTEGNDAHPLVDGAEYFACLLDELAACHAGDRVLLSDLEGNADEWLGGPGTEVSKVFAGLAARGVDVLALLWRSHPVGANTGQEDNVQLARAVNDAGGHALLDQRIRRGGSHHQKIVVIQRPPRVDRGGDVAFVGGIDLARGRNDDAAHGGDSKAAPLDDSRYGDRPPWHDVQVRVRGPAVAGIALTFRERWEDPTPLFRPSPWGALLSVRSNEPEERYRMPADDRPAARECGPHAVQVLRTYPTNRPPYPFAPRGERSIARAYLKAFGRARSLVYLEDQYLWSLDAARALGQALRREPELRVIVVIPRYPDPSGRLVGDASRYGREVVQRELFAAGADRVLVLDLENEAGTPVYVHSKVCIVDDIWMAVGSDNLNRRSWTHDSEVSCAILDSTRDRREPVDPGGRGDGARRLARETRLRLGREHLGLPDCAAADLVDPRDFFEAMRASAERLDAWHELGARGERPPGHVRRHPRDRVPQAKRPVLHAVHATILDPDGRPRSLRGRGY